jgi:hypothetical protein
MPECVFQILGALASLAAILLLAWRVWAHYDARRQRVKAELSIRIGFGAPAPSLCVWVTNTGRLPVYVCEVTLAWGRDTGRIGDEVTALDLQPQPAAKGPIQVGDGRLFLLPWVLPKPLLEQAAKEHPRRVWLSIKSPKGEMLRLKGKKVQPYLGHLANPASAPPQASQVEPGVDGADTQ